MKRTGIFIAKCLFTKPQVNEMSTNLVRASSTLNPNLLQSAVTGRLRISRSYGTINQKEDDDSEKVNLTTELPKLKIFSQDAVGSESLVETNPQKLTVESVEKLEGVYKDELRTEPLVETNPQEFDFTPYEQQISKDSQTAQNPTTSISQIVDLLEKWNKIIDDIPIISQKTQVLMGTLVGKEKTFNSISAKITETLTTIANSDLETEIAKLNMGLLNLKQLGALLKLLGNIQKKPEHIPYAISFIAEKPDNLPDTIGPFDKYVQKLEALPIVAPPKKDHNPAHIPFLPSENIEDLKRRTGLRNVRYGSAEEVAEATSKINQKKGELSRFSGNIAYSKSSIDIGGEVITGDVVMRSFSPSENLPEDFTNFELETKPIFTHLILDTENYLQDGIKKSNAWPRNRDSEYIILSILAKKLEKQAEEKQLSNKDIIGEVSIASLYPYCLSCQGVIKQFNLKFPNVCIILIDATKKK